MARLLGWLGAWTPEDFIRHSTSNAPAECHMTVDYESPEWRENVERATQCAGQLVSVGPDWQAATTPIEANAALGLLQELLKAEGDQYAHASREDRGA